MQTSQHTYEMQADTVDNYSYECSSEIKYDSFDDDEDSNNDSNTFIEIDYDSLITEDDTPVDNFYCEKQLRLLPGSLQHSWDRKQPYIVAADVGIYDFNSVTPIVPDVFLSLDVQYASDIWLKKNRCYMMNIFKKPPELIIEVVSNKIGGELTKKVDKYENLGVNYYVIFDPCAHILESTFCVYQLVNGEFIDITPENKEIWFEHINVGLKVHHGEFENMTAEWLRWCDAQGNILRTGDESAAFEKARADAERQHREYEKARADAEQKRAENEKNRAETLAKELERLKAELFKYNQ